MNELERQKVLAYGKVYDILKDEDFPFDPAQMPEVVQAMKRKNDLWIWLRENIEQKMEGLILQKSDLHAMWLTYSLFLNEMNQIEKRYDEWQSK